MGFNIRYISETTIRDIVKEEGLKYLIEFIKKSDNLIIEDEFSEKICDFIKENDKKYVLTELSEMDIWQVKDKVRFI